MRTDSPDLRPAFFWLGVCGIASSVTTVVNTVLPRFYSATGFDQQVALIDNPYYTARQWVLLVHPVFTLLAALGLLLLLWPRRPGLTSVAFLFAFVEKITEFFLSTSIPLVVNAVWKQAYLTSADAAVRGLMRARIQTFNDLLGGSYFLLWAAFAISTTLFAVAMWRGDRFARITAVTMLATVALTLMMIAGRFGGQQSWVDPILAVAYPPVLGGSRLLMGWWLIRMARAS
jgi:hypothetical protein